MMKLKIVSFKIEKVSILNAKIIQNNPSWSISSANFHWQQFLPIRHRKLGDY